MNRVRTDARITTHGFDFRELFEAYYPMVVKHVVYLTGDRAQAEDISQEVFLKLYRTPPKDFTNVAGWLLKTATNTAFNAVKSEKRRERREEAGLLDRLPVAQTDEVERFARVDAVRGALERIPKRDRYCLLLRYGGYDYKEISVMLGVRKNSVGTSISRALERFKTAYAKGESVDELFGR
ncbi:MAG: sigma-70 family RNA polymerase sigma factor [Candidatus Aquicultorales bacterium]